MYFWLFGVKNYSDYSEQWFVHLQRYTIYIVYKQYKQYIYIYYT